MIHILAGKYAQMHNKTLTEENLSKIRMIFLIFLYYSFTIYFYTTHVYFDWLKAKVQTIGSGI